MSPIPLSRRTAALLLVAALTAACAGRAAAQRSGAAGVREEGAIMTMEPTAGEVTAVECGQPLRPAADGRLALAGRFPAEVPAGAGSVTGTVRVTSRVALRGVIAQRADAFLVGGGRVVTVPAPQDAIGLRWHAEPGDSLTLPGEAPLVSCEPADAALPPGAYEVYAQVVVTLDDGSVVAALGGPWRIALR